MITPAICHADTHPKRLEDISEKLGIVLTSANDYTVTNETYREGNGSKYSSIVAEKYERLLIIHLTYNVDDLSAQRYIEESTQEIYGACRNIPSPYPGMISNTIECPEELKPEVRYIEVEEQNLPVLLLPSTSRFTYGASAEELIKYRGALIFIYNGKSKILYKVELFMPKGDFDKRQALSLLRSIRYYGQRETPDNLPSMADERLHHNLIIIAFDPLGAKHIGAYGYFRNTTPNIDGVSKKGFLFKNAISASSWTVPSVMSWFTSLYPSQHKLLNTYSVFSDNMKIPANLSSLSPAVVTLAQILRRNGYSTAGFTGGAGVSGSFGYNLGFDTYYDETPFGGFNLVLPMALEWLKEHQNEKFFLFLHGYDTHGRYPTPADFSNKYANPLYAGKYKGSPPEYWELRDLGLSAGYLNLSNEDVNFWISLYDSKLYEADKMVGEFLAELDRLKFLENTTVIISSPSGNEFYEHKRFDHGFSLYDELIHVPFIILPPGKDHGVIENQVRTIDIMPTALELLNINPDKNLEGQMQGVSLVPLMKGQNLRLDAFSETDYLSHTSKRSLRTADGWKYIHSTDTGQRELFDLKEDPQEMKNLVEVNGRIAYELEQKLFEHMKSIGAQ